MVGFVEFENIATAVAAKDALTGVCVIPNVPLHMQFSHSQPHQFSDAQRYTSPRTFHHRSPPADETLPVIDRDCVTICAENIPFDVTEREMCHVFRPYDGFIMISIAEKPSSDPFRRGPLVCYAVFKSKEAAENAISHLQMYRMDMNDPRTALTLSIIGN